MSEMQRDGSEMRCKRCGANESRIHGFCSVECEHYFDYEEEITDLNARIAELEENQRWIPVGERLPDEGKPVWICTIWNEQHSGLFVNGYWTGLFRDFRNGEVTHWMPLPELPKERE